MGTWKWVYSSLKVDFSGTRFDQQFKLSEDGWRWGRCIYDDVVERSLLINTFFQKMYSPLVVFGLVDL